MRFSAVVTAHGVHEFASIMYDLAGQTRQPDEVVALYSEVDYAVVPGGLACRTLLVPQPNLRDWGHAKRDLGLALVTGDAVGFFNHDDIYQPDYVEAMMRAIEDGAGFAYCDWDIAPCLPQACSSTSGNFVVRTELARAIGGWKHRHYEADGAFIDEVVAETRRRGLGVERIPLVLYRHNVR